MDFREWSKGEREGGRKEGEMGFLGKKGGFLL
jgi:hypothetical protein